MSCRSTLVRQCMRICGEEEGGFLLCSFKRMVVFMHLNIWPKSFPSCALSSMGGGLMADEFNPDVSLYLTTVCGAISPTIQNYLFIIENSISWKRKQTFIFPWSLTFPVCCNCSPLPESKHSSLIIQSTVGTFDL